MRSIPTFSSSGPLFVATPPEELPAPPLPAEFLSSEFCDPPGP